jgi:UDP:flavonoid glycosyltransferase YjiC (YdhE family)
MSRILIALEFGGNYGHLGVCLPVANALRARGHAVAFALRDLRLAAQRLAPAGFSFIQSPVLSMRARLSRPPANFAEILLGEGYGDVDGLAGLVGAWRNALHLAQPDLVLANFAPTALFAACLGGIPRLALGPSFSIPPNRSPSPSIRPWDDIPEGRLEQPDSVVAQHLECVAEKLGSSYQAGLSGLFGKSDLLTTFEELDCYPERSGGRYIGPIYGLPETPSVGWPASMNTRILAYLRSDTPGLQALLAALAARDAVVLCVIPGAKSDLCRQFVGTSLHIVAHPVNLQELLGQADLVVTYGGHGFLCEALQAACPMLVVPHFVEQALNAHRVERLGVGIAIGTVRSREVFDAALARILENPGFSERAQAFAERHAKFTPARSVGLAVEAVEAVLSDSV